MKINFSTVSHCKKLPVFKSNITFDIGGSQREGSCKIRYATSSNDEVLHTEKTTVNQSGIHQFKDGNDFIGHIVKKIARIQKDNEKIIEQKGYPKEENNLKNVAIFLPSYTSNNRAFYLANHRNEENTPLKNVDFTGFKERLLENGIKISDDFNFKIIQDAMGTGLAMTKKLYDNGKLQQGKYYTACITGGGCGISNIEVIDKDKVIVKSSGSSCLSQSMSMQKVSKAGASAPAIIENFCRAMGFNDEITEQIKSCSKAEFTMTEDTLLPMSDPKLTKLKNLLVSTNKFECIENPPFYELKVKDEFLPKYNIARRNAIDKYCLALARLAIIKKNEGSNGIIVTGTLAQAVDRTAKTRYNMGVAEWITQHLCQSFNSYELEKIQEAYNFEVICDKEYFIDNNTECKDLVYNSEFIDQKRGNWLRLDMKYLK